VWGKASSGASAGDEKKPDSTCPIIVEIRRQTTDNSFPEVQVRCKSDEHSRSHCGILYPACDSACWFVG